MINKMMGDVTLLVSVKHSVTASRGKAKKVCSGDK